MFHYPHHIGDFIRDTANLSDSQTMAYLRMLWKYYADESPLTGPCDRIAFAVRSDEKTVALILDHYFTETPEGWRHSRCDSVIAAYHGKAEKAAESARRRWEHANASKTDANAMRTDSERNANARKNDANHKPITINQKTEIKVSCPSDAEPVTTKTRFGEFWAAYPDKTGKKPSFDKWKAKRLDAVADKIVSDVNGRKARDRKWLDGFIPNPLTYLNQERWNDPIQEARPVQQQIRPMSKQEQGMAALMELRNEFMAGERNNRGGNEAVRPLLGRDTIGDDDSGDGDGLDRDD